MSYESHKICTAKGFSTMEMLLAMVIIIFALSAVILVSFGNQSVLADSQTNSEALSKAQEMLEQAQAQARKDFKLVNPLPQFSDGIYKKKLDVRTQSDNLTKEVTAVVSWVGDRGRTEDVSLSGLITNFTGSVGGDTCSSVLADSNGLHGNWSAPLVTDVLFGSINGINDSLGTYELTDLDANLGKLYVTSKSGSVTSPVLNPNSASDLNSVGVVNWLSPENVKVGSDSSFATAVLSSGSASHFLVANNFGFSIPSGATILGIKVEVQRKGSSTTNTVRDNQVRLVRADGNLGAQNKANTGSSWGTSESYFPYGAANDLWGEANLQASDINSPNFGIAISANAFSGASSRTASVDHVRITITYIKSFYVLDISNPNMPSLTNSLGSNPGISAGFNAVAVAGNYAYVATNTGPTSGQMQVIDISTNPGVVKNTFIVPGVTGVGAQAIGSSIFYKDGYVYLGLAATASGPEFNILDVHNPLAPVYVGGLSVGNGVNEILVKGNYAYVATPNPQELWVVDISNPAAPLKVGGFDAINSVGNGKSLKLVGDNIYFGRTINSSAEFYIINNTDPRAIPLTALGTNEIGSSVNSLIVRDYLTSLITTNGQFQIWRTDDVSNITSFITPINLPNLGFGIAMDCEGNYQYAVSVPTSGGFLNKGSLSIITGQ